MLAACNAPKLEIRIIKQMIIFVNSSVIWNARIRSLVENTMIFAYKKSRLNSEVRYDLYVINHFIIQSKQLGISIYELSFSDWVISLHKKYYNFVGKV